LAFFIRVAIHLLLPVLRL